MYILIYYIYIYEILKKNNAHMSSEEGGYIIHCVKTMLFTYIGH